MKIFVTKPFLPPIEEYQEYLKVIYESGILTNQGPLLRNLESKLQAFFNVPYIHCLSNGTIALQLALSALGISEGEIITTPFSYVATVSSILWERCTPVFVDIESSNFTIDASKIESVITSNTKAILSVHVFGYACNIGKIEDIAAKNSLKVIYDGAHAFGSLYRGKSLLSYGDISTLSFHSTKLFHTIEGGACIVRDKEVSDTLELQKRFGHEYDDHIMLGINAKLSEFSAAMGLANFKYIESIKAERKRICERYDNQLSDIVIRPVKQDDLEYNYAYYPVVFKSEEELLRVFSALNAEDIYPRRYFYPSLNKLPYIKTQTCPVAEDISSRIACLPLYHELEDNIVEKICKIIMGAVKQ